MFLITNLFVEEFEQAFRKRVDIITDIDLILVKEYKFTFNFLATFDNLRVPYTLSNCVGVKDLQTCCTDVPESSSFQGGRASEPGGLLAGWRTGGSRLTRRVRRGADKVGLPANKAARPTRTRGLGGSQGSQYADYCLYRNYEI